METPNKNLIDRYIKALINGNDDEIRLSGIKHQLTDADKPYFREQYLKYAEEIEAKRKADDTEAQNDFDEVLHELAVVK